MFFPILCAALTLGGCDKVKARFSGPKTAFSGEAAITYVKAQLAFGPRVPGTAGHRKTGDWIISHHS